MFIDVLDEKLGPWSRQEYVNERLRHLQGRLPSVIAGTRAPSTMTSYSQAFHRWKLWCEDVGLRHLPADYYDVALFVIEKADQGIGFGSIENYVASISLMHAMSGLNDPTKNPFLKQVLQALKRGLSVNKNAKNVVCVDDLQKMIEVSDLENLREIRICTMVILAFFGFLRISEVINIKFEDLSFNEDFVKIKIRKSKTDQFRSGQEVIIGKGEGSLCPIFILKKYLTKIELGESDFIFRSLQYSKEGVRFRDSKKPMTYSNTRDQFRSLIEKAGLSEKKLTLHALRAGGATAAAETGINDRIIQKQGRWKTESVKNSYIKESSSQFSKITSAILSSNMK